MIVSLLMTPSYQGTGQAKFSLFSPLWRVCKTPTLKKGNKPTDAHGRQTHYQQLLSITFYMAVLFSILYK